MPANEISLLDFSKKTLSKCCIDPLRPPSLQEAVVREDMKGVEVTAHTIKGILANVSFVRAAASAACLERMGQQCVTQGLPEELARLEQEASLALAELEAFCTEMIR